MDPVTKAQLICLANQLANAVNNSSLADCAGVYQGLMKLLLADDGIFMDELE